MSKDFILEIGTEPLPARVKIAFRLDAEEWQGRRAVKFLIEGVER